MDRVLRHAIALGLAPMTALQMATLNTAEHFGLSREIGQIAPGRWADILLVDDLEDFRAQLVIARGRIAAENGKGLIPLPETPYPDWARRSIHLKRAVNADDFIIRYAGGGSKVKVNVIGVIENQAPTRHLTLEMRPEGNEIRVDPSRDLAKVALVERHHGTGTIQVGFVQGFGFQGKCAVASTVAHDCHHILVAGTDEKDMSLAVNRLAETGGGQVVIREGEVMGQVDLPIGGLMSNLPAEKVASQAQGVLEALKTCGCKLNNANMTLSLLALVVIPELRISDKGLIDVGKFAILPVIEKAEQESR